MGNYVNNNLIKGEEVVYETTYHWTIFFSWVGLFTLFIAPFIKRRTDEFVITNKRVIVKTGLISRKTLEMNLNKIETVNVDQGIFARILGYGTVGIVGTGGTHETFPYIAHALEFRKKFIEASS